jgi:hypothetical protein
MVRFSCAVGETNPGDQGTSGDITTGQEEQASTIIQPRLFHFAEDGFYRSVRSEGPEGSHSVVKDNLVSIAAAKLKVLLCPTSLLKGISGPPNPNLQQSKSLSKACAKTLDG